jgi:importin subunit beta-1
VYILDGASQLARTNMSDEVDEDEIDYTNDLREGCLEGYTGIIVGMKGDVPTPDVVQRIMEKVPDIVRFITEIFKDSNLTDDNIRNSLGLVGDLVEIFGNDMCGVLSPVRNPASLLLSLAAVWFPLPCCKKAAFSDDNPCCRNS